jgi:hypothetical protein
MMEAARTKRDARLRHKLLLVLSIGARTAPTGMIAGRLLVDQAQGIAGSGQGFEEDQHAITLLRDLINAKFALEAPLGERRRGQRFGLDWVQYGITDEGTLLIEQKRPAHPLVDDDRQLEE